MTFEFEHNRINILRRRTGRKMERKRKREGWKEEGKEERKERRDWKRKKGRKKTRIASFTIKYSPGLAMKVSTIVTVLEWRQLEFEFRLGKFDILWKSFGMFCFSLSFKDPKDSWVSANAIGLISAR